MPVFMKFYWLAYFSEIHEDSSSWELLPEELVVSNYSAQIKVLLYKLTRYF
jgi:hypothetical protein